MTENMGKWPSKRGPISKIMPSDGCKGDTVPLEMGPWYYFHEVGCHLGNVGSAGERSLYFGLSTTELPAKALRRWNTLP